MKKYQIFIPIVLVAFLSFTNPVKSANEASEEKLLLADAQTVIESYISKSDVKHSKKYYKTWTVIEVTPDEIVLERNKRDDTVDTVRISRSRRPSLEVGDKVRYDKIRNRLKNTLDK